MPDKIQIVLDADVIMARNAGSILPDVDIESYQKRQSILQRYGKPKCNYEQSGSFIGYVFGR